MIMAGFEDARQIERDETIFKKAEGLYQLVEDEGRIAHIKTVGQAIDFTMDFDRRTYQSVCHFGNGSDKDRTDLNKKDD